jgi:hypothetical protein
MKVSRIFRSLLLAETLLIATSALAANDNKGALKVSEPVAVNGTKLAIGDYKVNWEGTGANVEVNISKSNKVVATRYRDTWSNWTGQRMTRPTPRIRTKTGVLP